MRKLVVEFRPYPHIVEAGRPVYDLIESAKVLEIIRFDLRKGEKMGISELTIREGHTIDEITDIIPSYRPDLFQVLKQDGNRYTVLSKVTAPEEYRHMLKDYDLDLAFVPPIIKSMDRVVVSVIGEEGQLKRFLQLIKRDLGEVINISLTKALFKEHDILSVLTDKQREIIVQAKKHGYYEYPRRINTEKLAKKLGIGRATLVEHLRKAEARLVEHILSGH